MFTVMKFHGRIVTLLFGCYLLYQCAITMDRSDYQMQTSLMDYLPDYWCERLEAVDFNPQYWIKPFLLLRRQYKYVIGIPTARRSYDLLNATLQSVFKCLENTSQTYIVIVQICDTEMHTIEDTVDMLRKEFSLQIRMGKIEVITVHPSWYKAIGVHQHIGNNSVLWEMKLVGDFTYLMVLSTTRGQYYLHLEDDISASLNFLQTIDNFVEEVQSELWISLEFSSVGLLGNLWRTSDLAELVAFLLTLNTGKPIHHLYTDYIGYIYPACDPHHVHGQCLQELGMTRILHRPSLFMQKGDQMDQRIARKYPLPIQVNSTRPEVDKSRPVWDTNRVINHEAWPWTDVPIYVNPPALISTTLHSQHSSLMDLYTLQKVQ